MKFWIFPGVMKVFRFLWLITRIIRCFVWWVVLATAISSYISNTVFFGSVFDKFNLVCLIFYIFNVYFANFGFITLPQCNYRTATMPLHRNSCVCVYRLLLKCFNYCLIYSTVFHAQTFFCISKFLDYF